MKIGVLVLAVLCLGAGTCYAAMYELKQDNVACVIINSTLIVSMDYVTKLNKTARVSWTLSKPGPTSISGLCAKKSPGNSWSEIVINASNTIVGFRFVSQPNGYVSLANVSLTVDIVNGSRFKNPMSPGRVRLVAKPSLSLSSNIECFACHSKIGLNMKAENKTVTSIGQLQLTGGTVIQAFNLTKGKFSDKVTQCPQDANSTTTSTMAPITTSTPPSEPPEITLTVNSRITGQPCLRLRSRLRMQVDYLRPGMVAIATVFLREDATATGDCGDADSANGTEPVHQTMTVTFFDDWQLTFSLARSGSVYSLVGLQLVYSVSNRDVFPGASDAGKQLFASSNATFFSDVSSNGYYDCHRVNFSMKGPAIPYTHQDTGIELIGEQFTMQAFRNVAKNSTDAFVGDRKDCLQDRVDNIVPIVVGASLAALVVIVLLAYLIGRRRAATRDGYQSV